MFKLLVKAAFSAVWSLLPTAIVVACLSLVCQDGAVTAGRYLLVIGVATAYWLLLFLSALGYMTVKFRRERASLDALQRPDLLQRPDAHDDEDLEEAWFRAGDEQGERGALGTD